MKPAVRSASNNTTTVARNSFWYGAENLVSVILLFATTIPMARILGPEKLGYFNYIQWLTAMSSAIGNLGIPGMCGKFMAEYLGRRQDGTAKAIFMSSFRLHLILATGVTIMGVAAALIWADPRHRTVTLLQILSIWPGMLLAMPSAANIAAERMRANFPGAMVSSGIYIVGTILSLWLSWDLVGIAATFIIGRSVELIVKLIPCLRWMRKLPDESLPDKLRTDMRSFALQQVGLLILGLVVWDRSDVVLLKALSADIRQVTYFTVAFNIADKVLMAPRVFGAALTASMMAQYGRNIDSLNTMAAAAVRYMYLLGAPLLTGMALVGPSVIRILYGPLYSPAVPVLIAGCLLAIVKSIGEPSDSLLKSNNKQGMALITSVVTAVMNIGLDWLWIPWHGALGAAFGNGIAQGLHVLSYWIICLYLFRVRLDYRSLGSVSLACAAMAPPVLLLNHLLTPVPALVCGVTAGAATFVLTIRVTGFITAEDLARFGHVVNATPPGLRPVFQKILAGLKPAIA